MPQLRYILIVKYKLLNKNYHFSIELMDHYLHFIVKTKLLVKTVTNPHQKIEPDIED